MPDYAPVDELVQQSGSKKLFAFTHGRSVFITNSAVPVELINFTASIRENHVVLHWETVTETNNLGFEIERAIVLPELVTHIYKTIGYVEGAGNSYTPLEYSFIDNYFPTLNNKNYKIKYRLKQLDMDGSYNYTNVSEIQINPLDRCELFQNYPNPFNPITTIRFYLQEKTFVRLTISNLNGELVRVLLDQETNAGIHFIEFNNSLKNFNLSSGVYFYTLRSQSGFFDTKKLIILN
jgi:hypothetical protein